MNKFHIKRLEKLIKYMRTNVKTEWFNMEIWAEQGFENKKCGTTACALGWATQAFPEDLQLVRNIWSTGLNVFLKSGSSADTRYDGQAFFGLTPDEFDYLFLPMKEVGVILKLTPKQWAKRAEKFLKKKRKAALNEV